MINLHRRTLLICHHWRKLCEVIIVLNFITINDPINIIINVGINITIDK